MQRKGRRDELVNGSFWWDDNEDLLFDGFYQFEVLQFSFICSSSVEKFLWWLMGWESVERSLCKTFAGWVQLSLHPLLEGLSQAAEYLSAFSQSSNKSKYSTGKQINAYSTYIQQFKKCFWKCHGHFMDCELFQNSI